MTHLRFNSKRNFKESPEPKSGKPERDSLRFVVQKHDASRLHYDFRLEIDGVLKSWAVPKGPSTDPDIKRLAMEVEDHPFDYRSFEGVIPGGYGAGTVMVWDEGTCEPAEGGDEDKTTQNKRLRDQWKEGKLKFILKGQKLKGEFVLVKSKSSQDNVWLLIKVTDLYASKTDITKKDKSVLSGKRLGEIEKSNQDRFNK
ncbi:MAG: DNA polymerase ligase N-terminal domain-containing protein [Saprospiraceae bacterium]|nr:DNA polymerase ligase N-terminal domain-containing protein [Saprospiraceae bacterium]